MICSFIMEDARKTQKLIESDKEIVGRDKKIDLIIK